MPNETERSPSRGALVVFLVLCLVGIGVAADLTAIHVKVHTDPNYRSFCAISKEVNCDTVAESGYSVFLGLPNSVWGLAGYLVMIVLAVWGLRAQGVKATEEGRMSRAWPSGLLLLLSGFSVVVSVVLAVISKVIIKSICLMCVASWVVALGLLIAAVVAARKVGLVAAVREDVSALLGRPALAAGLAMVALISLSVLWVFYPRYWVPSGAIGPGPLAAGTDPSGLPWIGAKTPSFTVVEFSDYQCPHCARAHHDARKQLERFPEVRLVHRNFPLDQTCNSTVKRSFHDAACVRAVAAVCAGKQGKFWEMSDLLFLGQSRETIDVTVLAKQLGLDVAAYTTCVASNEAMKEVVMDVDEGTKHSIRGTPWFVVQGAGFAGKVPFELIGAAICAGEQGKLTEVSEEFFSKGNKVVNVDYLVATYSLDAAKFQACIALRPPPARAR